MTQHYPRIKNNSLPPEPAGTVRNHKSKTQQSPCRGFSLMPQPLQPSKNWQASVGMISADWW
jgi:hypothetical protein